MIALARPLLLGAAVVVAAGQASPDGTRVPPAAQIVDAAGDVWTLAGTSVLRNGQPSSGQGSVITWCGAVVRTFGTDSQWWSWTGTAWTPIGTTDPCPPPPPHPCDTAGTSAPAVPQGVAFRAGFCAALVDPIGNPQTITSCALWADGVSVWDGAVTAIGTPSPVSAQHYYELGPLALTALGPHVMTVQCRRKDPPSATEESALSLPSAPVTLTVISGTLPRMPLPPGVVVVIRL